MRTAEFMLTGRAVFCNWTGICTVRSRRFCEKSAFLHTLTSQFRAVALLHDQNSSVLPEPAPYFHGQLLCPLPSLAGSIRGAVSRVGQSGAVGRRQSSGVQLHKACSLSRPAGAAESQGGPARRRAGRPLARRTCRVGPLPAVRLTAERFWNGQLRRLYGRRAGDESQGPRQLVCSGYVEMGGRGGGRVGVGEGVVCTGIQTGLLTGREAGRSGTPRQQLVCRGRILWPSRPGSVVDYRPAGPPPSVWSAEPAAPGGQSSARPPQTRLAAGGGSSDQLRAGGPPESPGRSARDAC